MDNNQRRRPPPGAGVVVSLAAPLTDDWKGVISPYASSRRLADKRQAIFHSSWNFFPSAVRVLSRHCIQCLDFVRIFKQVERKKLMKKFINRNWIYYLLIICWEWYMVFDLIVIIFFIWIFWKNLLIPIQIKLYIN